MREPSAFGATGEAVIGIIFLSTIAATVAPHTGARLTNSEIRWLKHIARHGPQSSQTLHELTRNTRRCKDTSLRQMQKLRAGGFLQLPRQQRATEYAEFNPCIDDLTPRANERLFDLGLDAPAVRPTGHWWHGYMTSCITNAIDIAAAREGVRFIPAHEILAINGAELAIPVQGRRLIPDQLFALDYGGSFRVFALEVDRGTEPKTSAAARKSYASALEQYDEVLSKQIYKTHCGLKATLLVLWVFSSRSNERKFLEMTGQYGGALGRQVLTQVADMQNGRARLAGHQEHYQTAWQAASGSEISISRT